MSATTIPSPMTANKTTFTDASIEAYLASRATERQRPDCEAIMALLARVTGEPPRMYGPSIVGYGRYRYTYASGHSGEAPLTGFAIRGRDVVIYVAPDVDGQQDLLRALGKHKMGKSCLHLRQLADVDVSILERIVADAVADTRRRYGEQGADNG